MGLNKNERLRMLAALRRSPLFGRASAHLFHDLLADVQVRTLARGDRLAHEDEFFFTVISGRLHVYVTAEGGARRLSTVLKPGDTYGETQLLRGEAAEHDVVADAPARVAVFPKAGLEHLPPDMHRELHRTSHELEGHAHGFQLAARQPAVIYISALEQMDARTVDALAVQLSMAIEAQFNERAIAVGRHHDGWRALPAPPESANKPKKKPKMPETWQAAAEDRGMLEADYLVVSLGAERRPHVLPEVQTHDTEGLHIVLTPPDVEADHAAPDWERSLRTVLLDPTQPPTTKRTTIDLFGYDEGRKRTCRLMLGKGALARAAAARDEAARQAFFEEYKDTLERWARFATRRSVAVALGGGGAWGYFHVGLLERMAEAGVPVDITSGTSFGSLVSVYFAAKGLDGLKTLTARGRSFGLTQTLSLVSTHPLELQIADDLGGADLSRLPIAANPFTTNLTAVEGQAAFRGPAALGARASSSAPGLFGPTVLAGRGVFVDGVVSGNVPSAILIAQGADMLVASNVIPRPASKPVPTWAPARWLSTVNPLDRVYEAFLSAMFFLYAQGLEQGLGCLTVQGNDAIEAMPSVPTPSDFGEASAIVAAARRHPSMDEAVEAISREWERRKRSRSA